MSEDRVIDRLLAAMPLERKAGQVMLVGLDPTETRAAYTALTPQGAALVADLGLGGIVYFERNVGAPAELARLSADLQQTALDAGLPGLLLAIDQEGGRVVRMRERRGYTEIPSALALGATGDPENARRAAAVLAAEMRACGINMDLAPVLDINNNPANQVIGTRSFGADPAQVAAFGLAYIEALQTNSIMAVGKHFPGKGDSGVDSHFFLPTIAHGRERLEAVEFVPFRAAMRAGVAGIMSSHVVFPAIDDSGIAATLSPRVMTGLLRDEMGYDGLLLTDSLEMGALATSGYPVSKAAVTALAAGADILCMSHGYRVMFETHAAIVRAVRDGRLPEAHLDTAVRRILAAKAQYGLLDPAPLIVPRDVSGVGLPAACQSMRAIARQSITLLRDRDGLLPLRPGAPLFVVEFARLGSPVISGVSEPVIAPALADRFGGEGAPFHGVAYHEEIGAEQIRGIVERASGRTAVVATSDAHLHPWQVETVRALQDAGCPLIVVATASPYDLLKFPEVGTCLATYGVNPPLVEALVAVLAGEQEAVGRLPGRMPIA